jgi:hypothetical protein
MRTIPPYQHPSRHIGSPPTPSFQHRLDIPSNSATACYHIHVAVTGQPPQPTVPHPTVGAPIPKPHQPTPDIWTNRTAAQPFTVKLRIKARTLAYVDTWGPTETAAHRLGDPNFTQQQQQFFLSKLKHLLNSPRKPNWTWAHITDTYSCPITSPYPAGCLTSSLNTNSTEAYLRACLLRSTTALDMANAQPRCLLWTCRSFKIHTPYLERYVNSGDCPDSILKRVMTESKLSYADAKNECI